jgi:hypothetical protein
VIDWLLTYDWFINWLIDWVIYWLILFSSINSFIDWSIACMIKMYINATQISILQSAHGACPKVWLTHTPTYQQTKQTNPQIRPQFVTHKINALTLIPRRTINHLSSFIDLRQLSNYTFLIFLILLDFCLRD